MLAISFTAFHSQLKPNSSSYPTPAVLNLWSTDHCGMTVVRGLLLGGLQARPNAYLILR